MVSLRNFLIGYSYMDIIKNSLTDLERINKYMIDQNTEDVCYSFFYPPFSLYNTNFDS